MKTSAKSAVERVNRALVSGASDMLRAASLRGISRRGISIGSNPASYEKLVRKGGLECPHKHTFNDLQGPEAMLRSLKDSMTRLLDWYWTVEKLCSDCMG
jgi:hypothetical protein